MKTNGIEIPDAGTTSQFIPDPIGGWIYEVVSTIIVNQHRADAVAKKLEAAQQTLAEAQKAVADLTAEVEAVAAVMPAVAADTPTLEK